MRLAGLLTALCVGFLPMGAAQTQDRLADVVTYTPEQLSGVWLWSRLDAPPLLSSGQGALMALYLTGQRQTHAVLARPATFTIENRAGQEMYHGTPPIPLGPFVLGEGLKFSWFWNGRNDEGQPLPPGEYVLRTKLSLQSPAGQFRETEISSPLTIRPTRQWELP